MFTGLVVAMGAVAAAAEDRGEMDLDVDLSGLAREPAIGDSVALSGVCCTVVRLEGGVGRFHLSRETLDRTWLGRCRPGSQVNLEPALRAGDALGGHLVQGHVDGVGEVTASIDPEAGGDLCVRVPSDLARYCVQKGSITLDGVSLTIAELRGPELRLAIIPHTARVTTLGRKLAGDPVHIEVDVIGKYVERLLAERGLLRS
ncbi:MAG: riboflavin synthase [Planctomycetota bacterium]